MINIGERLEEIREKNDLRKGEMADQLDVSRTALSNWLHGRKPPLEVVIKICEIYDVSADWLLGIGE